MSADPSPALPWGNGAPATDAPAEGTDALGGPGKALEAVGLKVGAKLEVKWEVRETESEEEGEGEQKDEKKATIKWWGATVAGPGKAEEGDTLEPNTFELLYDDWEDFKAERCNVKFTGEHTLFDYATDNEMVWRKEGEAWEEDVAEEEGEEDPTLSAADIQKALEPHAAAMEAREKEFMAKMDPAQQAIFASGAREFTDQLKVYLAAKPAGHTVTPDDIKEFEQQVKKPRLE